MKIESSGAGKSEMTYESNALKSVLRVSVQLFFVFLNEMGSRKGFADGRRRSVDKPPGLKAERFALNRRLRPFLVLRRSIALRSLNRLSPFGAPKGNNF